MSFTPRLAYAQAPTVSYSSPHTFSLNVAGTPAAVTLAATAPSVHHRLSGPAPPACMPNQVAKATPARLTIVVR